MSTIDPTFDKRLKAAYETAMAEGLWQGTYASSNRVEYWAQSTIIWFYPGDTSHSYDFNNQQGLKAYDPKVGGTAR